MKKAKSQPMNLAAFRFVLPAHDANRRRKTYLKIEPTAATPLDVDEIIEQVLFSNRHEISGKGAVEISAIAAKAINALAKLACAGDGKALWQFAEIVSDAADILNKIAETKPEAIKPFARRQVHWPMFRSTHPLLCDSDGLLERIELGKATGAQLDRYSKWKPDAAAVCAHSLIKHVEAIRCEIPALLPPFTTATAERWWLEAKKFLLASYPKPEEIAELDGMVTAATKRKYPSTRRVAILEKIRVRFFHLASCQS